MPHPGPGPHMAQKVGILFTSVLSVEVGAFLEGAVLFEGVFFFFIVSIFCLPKLGHAHLPSGKKRDF